MSLATTTTKPLFMTYLRNLNLRAQQTGRNLYEYARISVPCKQLSNNLQQCRGMCSSSILRDRKCTPRCMLFANRTREQQTHSSVGDLDSECSSLRLAFWNNEQRLENSVNVSMLTEKEKLIQELHKVACQEYKFTYIDPDTGYKVFTRYRHFLRGKCCGTGCRHCPYEHEAVSDDRKMERKFNSSFYVPITEYNLQDDRSEN